MRSLRTFLLRSVAARLALGVLVVYSALRRRRLICLTVPNGQLGNRLFLSCHVTATALENSMEVLNPAFLDYAPHFEHSAGDTLCRFPQRDNLWLFRWPSLREPCRRLLDAASDLIDPNLGRGRIQLYQLKDPESLFDCSDARFRAAIRDARVIFLKGWYFRNYELVMQHADTIRHHLRPRSEIQQDCESLVQTLRRDVDVLIGVHIRHGDYRTAWGGGLYFPTEKYVAWMGMMSRQLSGQKVGFLVSSNEAQDVRCFAGLNVKFRTPSPSEVPGSAAVRDLVTLSLCDYLIAPPSTFSGWASFSGSVPICFVRHPDHQLSLQDFKVCELRECPGW